MAEVSKGPESSEGQRPQEAKPPVDVQEYGNKRNEQMNTVKGLEKYNITPDTWENIKVGMPNAQINNKGQIVDGSKVLVDLATIEDLFGKIVSINYSMRGKMLSMNTDTSTTHQVALGSDIPSLEQQLGIPGKKDTMKKSKEKVTPLPEGFTRFSTDGKNSQLKTEFAKYGLSFDGIDRLYLSPRLVINMDMKGYEEFPEINFNDDTAGIKVGASEKGGVKVEVINKKSPKEMYHITTKKASEITR